MDVMDTNILSKLEVEKKLYHVEWFRLNSFNKWKGPSEFQIKEAVEIGFYHIQSNLYNDAVCCIHCDVVLFSSLLKDTIKIEHLNQSPKCREIFNIPQRYLNLTQYIIDSIISVKYNNSTLSYGDNKKVELSELIYLYNNDASNLTENMEPINNHLTVLCIALQS